VASFLEDSECYKTAVGKITEGIRNIFANQLREHGDECCYTPCCSRASAWCQVSHFTDVIQTLSDGDLQRLASEFMLTELMSAPVFMLNAYLLSIAPSGWLDLSCLQLSDDHRHNMTFPVGLFRVFSLAAKMRFRHVSLPCADVVPELHVPSQPS
jgi:hypothetical protein